jgi:hypothetical protein
MSLAELQQFSDTIADDVFAVLSLEGSVNARNHIGGTAPNQVLAAGTTRSFTYCSGVTNMTRMVMCRKYGQEMEGLAFAPFPAAKGQAIFDTVSKQA